jgi:hypothetical protein
MENIDKNFEKEAWYSGKEISLEEFKGFVENHLQKALIEIEAFSKDPKYTEDEKQKLINNFESSILYPLSNFKETISSHEFDKDRIARGFYPDPKTQYNP